MKLRKILALLMALVLVIGMVSACGGGDDDTSDDTATEAPADDAGDEATEAPAEEATEAPADDAGTGEDVEITWMFWDDLESSEDLMTKQYAATLERFNAADNGYHVTAVTTNDVDQYMTKLNASVGTPDMPDVFMCDPGPKMNSIVQAGAAKDVTELLNADAEWKGSFKENIFDRLTYDGKIMAIPTNFASCLLYYNLEIFEEAGVEVPETWDDFVEVCKTIQENTDKAPLTVSAGTNWCLAMLGAYLCDRAGGPENLAGINDGSVKWTDDSFVTAMEKMLEVQDYMQETAMSDDNDVATSHFYNGEAAMLIQGSWAIGQINGEVPEMEDKYGVFRFPALEGGGDPDRWIVKTDNMCINAALEDEKLDACIALMKMFTDEQAQRDTAEIAGKMPIIDVEIDYEKAPKQLKFVEDAMQNATGTLGFYDESFATQEAGGMFNDTTVAIMLGDKTVEEGLEELQTYFEDSVYTQDVPVAAPAE